MAVSTQSIFKAIETNQLLSSADLKKANQKWNKAGREGADDPFKLARWLTVNRYLSLYQADKLLLEQPNELIHGPFRVKSQAEIEPMAGWLVAEDKLRRQVYLQPITPNKGADPAKLSALVKTAATFHHSQVLDVIGLVKGSGREFLVREYFSGDSLQSLIDRKATLGALPVAKLFSLLFNAVAALLEKGLYPGDLNLNSFWIVAVPGGKSNSQSKTVRIIDAGVPSCFLSGVTGETSSEPASISPGEAVFRIAIGMYEVLSGVAPYPEYSKGTKPFTAPGTKPASIWSLRPDLPESIANMLDELVSPNSAGNEETPSHVAKKMRVLISAEEHSAAQNDRDALNHHSMVVGTPGPARLEDETNDEELTAADRMLQSVKHWLEGMGIFSRDLIVFTAGALTFLFIIIFSLIFFRWDLIPILCMGLGAGFGYVIERFFRSAEGAVAVAELSSDIDNPAKD